MAALNESVVRQTVESLSGEITRVVAARRALREAGAPEAELEANRVELMARQGQLTELLIERHLGSRHAPQ